VFDSCASRRPGGAPDLLRQALSALGQDVVNGPQDARHAVCCGAAGSLAELHPLSAARMAAARSEPDSRWPTVGSDTRCLGHLANGGEAERYFGLAEFVLAHFDVAGRT
jgi:DNA helicase HerA-like ATPase